MALIRNFILSMLLRTKSPNLKRLWRSNMSKSNSKLISSEIPLACYNPTTAVRGPKIYANPISILRRLLDEFWYFSRTVYIDSFFDHVTILMMSSSACYTSKIWSNSKTGLSEFVVVALFCAEKSSQNMVFFSCIDSKLNYSRDHGSYKTWDVASSFWFL